MGETSETRWEPDLAASRHSLPYRVSRSMDADAVLASHSSGELRKEFPCEVGGIGSVADMLAAKIVVEDSAVGCFVDVWKAEIHAVAFDGAGHATDEDHSAIRFLLLDDPDVRQWVVYLAVSIVVPCVVEEDEVAGIGDRSPVEPTLLSYVRMDDPDAVSVRVAQFTVIEVDSVFEEDCAGHSGAVVGDVPAVALNRCGTHELDRCLHNRGSAQRELDGSTTGARFRC
jgi:hypothetical protein